MDHRELVLMGTALEVIGTFFLAMEAIKLPNLRFLRERIFKVAALKINPMIHFVDKETSETRAAETWFNSLFVVFIALGLSLLYITVRLTGHSLSDLWQRFSSIVPGPQWLVIVVAVPAAIVTVLVSSFVGTAAYTLIVLVLDGAIATLSFIEKNTASGVIGILGFVTFLIGAVTKAYMEWTGG